MGIVLLGYPPEGLVDGRPARNSPPFFFAKMDVTPSEWPVRIDANVPVGLQLLVVWDRDGDGVLSPADRLSAPVEVSDSGAIEAKIARDFADLLPEGSTPAVLLGSAPLDPQESIAAGPAGREQRLAPGVDALAPTPPRTVLVSPSPLPEGEEPVALLLLGYPPGGLSNGRPVKDVLPVFFHKAEAAPGQWPLRVDAGIPAGLWLLAVWDRDGDGFLGGSDRVGTPVVVPEAGPIEVGIDQDFGLVPSSSPGPSRVVSSGLLIRPDRELVSSSVRVTLPAGLALSGVPSVMLAGYPPGGISNGVPTPGTVPAFFWSSGEAPGAWPKDFVVPLPRGLDLLVVLDLDGDGLPGSADWIAEPIQGFQPPRAGRRVDLAIARPFAPLDVPSPLVGGGAMADGDGDGDGDDDDSGADGEDDSGEAPDGEAIGRGVVRQLVLDSRPRVPFLREGRVMVVGYPRQEVERGMPAAGAQPTFFWRSEELRLTWPLRIEAPLPSGRTVFLVLDLDEDGMPSPGDLCSVPAYDFEPPAEGREAPFVFERAFGLTEPDEDELLESESGR